MTLIAEIPEYLNIGITLNWCFDALHEEKDCTKAIFRILHENYRYMPVTMLDGYLRNPESTLTKSGIKSVGDFFDLIGSCLQYDVFKIGIYHQPCHFLTPNGITNFDTPYMKFFLKTIDKQG